MADADIERAAALIREGGLVAMPTETVYGLGAHALDVKAVARIFEAKDRPRFDPLIVHVLDVDAAKALLVDPPESVDELAAAFWPGPLTIVAKKAPHVPDLVTAGKDTVAVRVPSHPMARALLAASGRPIAAPSANRFGSVSPTSAEHVTAQLGDAVDMVLDGGPCEVGVESTIVSLAGDVPLLLRPGGVTLEALRKLLGRVDVPDEDSHRTSSPGRQSSHYAPATPLCFIEDRPADGRQALLAFTPPESEAGWAAVEVLSATGDTTEAAQNLFGAIRRLDALELDQIVVTPVPEVGLGRAIMDRLRRAAAKRLPSTSIE